MGVAMRVRFAIILLFLATCSTTTGNIDDTTEWETAAQQADRSIVFGRIRWIENGEEVKIGQGDFVKMSLRPDLVCMEDKQRIQGSIDAEGHFAWSLKPGTYLMHRLVYRDMWSGAHIIVPKVAFAVPAAGQVYYIGTLQGDFAKKRDFLGTVGGGVRFSVQSERYEEEARLRAKCGLKGRSIQASMMRHDDRLPETVETTQGFLLATQIITAMAIYGGGGY